MIYENFKIWFRIQSIKILRKNVSKKHFDRYDWLFSSIELWHLRFNMLQLIHRIHWGIDMSFVDSFILQYVVDRWKKSRMIQNKNFQTLKNLIVHNYQIRIVGMFICLLQNNGENIRRIESIVNWLKKISSNTNEFELWLQFLKFIATRFHSILFNHKFDTKFFMIDEQFVNHQNFCHHVEIYLTFRYSIKIDDIELLRHAFRHVIVMFQFSTTNISKYAQTFLYTLHITDSSTSHKILQNAVLMNELINFRNAIDFNFETNRFLKLLNNNFKFFQQKRIYFSKNNDEIFNNWSLNNSFLLKFKKIVEIILNKSTSIKHSVKSAVENIWNMTMTFNVKFLRQIEHDRFFFSSAVNLYYKNFEILTENIAKYNAQYLTKIFFENLIVEFDSQSIEITNDLISSTNSILFNQFFSDIQSIQMK